MRIVSWAVGVMKFEAQTDTVYHDILSTGHAWTECHDKRVLTFTNWSVGVQKAAMTV